MINAVKKNKTKKKKQCAINIMKGVTERHIDYLIEKYCMDFNELGNLFQWINGTTAYNNECHHYKEIK